ncbi:MAG: EamA/RhaT family transporter, partial [Bacteroidales bacterium]|nr:EamA/RhaT family transporter [Bacteroidales bacterium]
TATLCAATRLIAAPTASVMGVFEPVTAILVGALAFGEKVTVNVIVGIVLTMAAIVFMVLSSAHESERQ